MYVCLFYLTNNSFTHCLYAFRLRNFPLLLFIASLQMFTQKSHVCLTIMFSSCSLISIKFLYSMTEIYVQKANSVSNINAIGNYITINLLAFSVKMVIVIMF